MLYQPFDILVSLLTAVRLTLALVQAPALPGAQAISSADRVYVGDQSSNTVSVINPATNQVLGTIALGSSRLTDILNPQYVRPSINTHGLGFSRDGRFINVVSVASNTVTVIRTSDNSVVSESYVGRAPHEAFFSPDNRTVWVGTRGTSQVDIVDGLIGGVVGHVETADGPSKVLFSPDGRTAYVNHIRSPTIDIVDVHLRRVVDQITGLADKFSSDMMLSPDGRSLWAAHKMVGKVSVMDVSARRVVAVLDSGPETNHPNFITSKNGTLFGWVTVASLNETKIYRQDKPSAIPVYVGAVKASGIEPHGIWPSPDNTRMYIVNEHSDTLDVVDASSLQIVKTLHVGQEGQAVVYVAGAVTIGNGTSNLSSQGLNRQTTNKIVSIPAGGSALVTVRGLQGLDMFQVIGRSLEFNTTYTAYASTLLGHVEIPLVDFMPNPPTGNATGPGCGTAPQHKNILKIGGAIVIIGLAHGFSRPSRPHSGENTAGEGIWGVAGLAQPYGELQNDETLTLQSVEWTLAEQAPRNLGPYKGTIGALWPNQCTGQERVIGHRMLRPYAPSSGRPRESVFISGPLPQDNEPVCSPYVEACVAAAQESCDKIYDAQCSLRAGVADLPRMSKVLQNERLFALINESHAAMYKTQLAEEVEPQITELTNRAEKGIKQLERKENVLTSKLDAARASSRASTAPSIAAKKLNVLTKQREALEKELQSLSDEVERLEGQLMA
ncbi:cytochrome cd1-nitrite reductase-like protein [Gautieria morchelliformis]|nr:cytochrome cd1-nitrite reductase-like protein [Gautieria morchelliformis]